ncbi:MAG: hypothetical protein IPG90_18410 [Bacteroidetes bacterium]|nr:hypothetical protein [Bacteroidota bacterium]
MMKKKKNPFTLLTIGFAVTALLMTSACKKDNQNSDNKDDFSNSASDMGQVENIYSDVDNMVAQASETGAIDQRLAAPSEDLQFNFSGCALVTRDTVNHTLTIDFGTGCTGQDGRLRSGKVIVTYTGGGYFTPGASWTITFDNYFVNSRHIEGTRTVTNNGFNSSNNMNWHISAVNMKVTRTDGTWRTWNSERTREMIAGYGDSLHINDIYKVNGTATSTHSSGDVFNAVITDLIRDNSCYWITSGTIAITPPNGVLRTIDFGNGSCDDLATVTKNGNVVTFHLRP